MDDTGDGEGAWLGLGGYDPRPQFMPLHGRSQRWAVMVAHRRAGKTVACVADLVIAALASRRGDARFAYVAPLFNQAKDIAWSYLKRLTLDLGATINESELRVNLPNGSLVRLYGADNYERMRGGFFDGIVLDEYGDMEPRAWAEVIRPMLADRQGWAVFIGTPKGRNHFCEIWESASKRDDWFRLMLRASETGLIPGEELTASAADMTPEQYAQEFECSFEAAIVGAYYGKLMADAEREKRIASVPWEPRAPVTTAWDLGIGDSTAIWFAQQVGNEVRIIDYVENSGVALSWYAGEVMERKARGWAFADHLLPHDAEARELGTGKTRTETLASLGITGRVLPAQAVDDGINAVRLLLPRCWFDGARCARGLEALRQYRTEWDDKRKVFRDRPLHDWSSHAADAFRYLAMGLRAQSKPKAKREGHSGPGGWLG